MPTEARGKDELIWIGDLQFKQQCKNSYSRNILFIGPSISRMLLSTLVWLAMYGKLFKPMSFNDIWKYAKNKSPLIKQVWLISACIILKELWFQKNKNFFEEIKPNIHSFKCRIMKLVNEGGLRITGNKWNQNYDLSIIAVFNLGLRNSKFQEIRECQWLPPDFGFTMFCCDGSSLENPGAAGFGVVVREHYCQVLGTLTRGIGIASNYKAQVYAIICAMELATKWCKEKIIIVSDTQTVVNEFVHG
ncbi:uncharacterized protein LOC113360600 [Papaver somniferum]|uniref:uncharacterized protein LOC113360600 n=1 Tax=Papaver somniferum TaxID=3469 RepID=UPI000E6FE810|nr:uncharacterized protein LOC113360600 [Papaver somniferum]